MPDSKKSIIEFLKEHKSNPFLPSYILDEIDDILTQDPKKINYEDLVLLQREIHLILAQDNSPEMNSFDD
ncbi:MAG: hypothetical protein NZL83_00185 [Candidatus Absconditabacterales bacterium]|nr:hypothetical protein [Candidatus Absconditabacterales bacterium]